MREIIFRGKRVGDGEWVYGNVIFKTTNAYSTRIDCGIQSDYNYPEEVYPETVGQYTGLKDINGTMIFEGDIVGEADDKERVVYKEEFACFALEYIDVAGNKCSSILYSCLDNQEVVGNIHDNLSEEMEW